MSCASGSQRPPRALGLFMIVPVFWIYSKHPGRRQCGAGGYIALRVLCLPWRAQAPWSGVAFGSVSGSSRAVKGDEKQKAPEGALSMARTNSGLGRFARRIGLFQHGR
jgi:hypothetical protein